jgi:hypothetical protein
MRPRIRLIFAGSRKNTCPSLFVFNATNKDIRSIVIQSIATERNHHDAADRSSEMIRLFTRNVEMVIEYITMTHIPTPKKITAIICHARSS